MMKRFVACMLIILLVFTTCAGLAEEWTCPSCGNTASGNFCSNCGTASPAAGWTCPNCGTEANGQFCSNCGTSRDGAQSGATVSDEVKALVDAAIAHTSASVDPSPDKYTCYVEDYVGKNLASFGYTSMGGDRREYYGKTTVEFALYSVDGTFVNINDETELRKYIVIDQSPAPNAEFKLTYRKNSKGEEYSNLIDHQGYDVIDLKVARLDGTVYDTVRDIKMVQVDPAQDKYNYYVRNYVGRNLASAGYTSLGGQRMDAYGASHVQLVLVSNDGSYVDIEDEEQVKSYVVVRQDVAPNTPLQLTYRKNSKGEEYDNLIESQSVSKITLYLEKVNVLVAKSKAEETPKANETEKPDLEVQTYEVTGQVNTYRDFQYVVLGDGNAQIVGYTGTGSSVSISSEIDGHAVTSIGPAAFANKKLDTVIMWADIVDFGDECFKGCTELTSISIPSSAVTIGDSAFEGCTGLETVILWGDIETFGKCAFKDCTALTSISIPSSTKTIRESAFEGCTALKSIVMWGGNVIEANAFKECTALTDLTVPSEVTMIGNHAFDGCSELGSVFIWGGDTKLGNGVFDNCPNAKVSQW